MKLFGGSFFVVALLAMSAQAQSDQQTCVSANSLRFTDANVNAAMHSMVVESPLSIVLQGGLLLASGGFGGTIAGRVEYFGLQGLFLGAHARANFSPARAYFGEARVGLVLDHSYGTVWIPAGVGSYDSSSSESHVEGNYLVTTTTTTRNYYAWPDHCRLVREDDGLYAGVRGLMYRGDDEEIPQNGGAISAGYFLRSRNYSGGSSFNNDGTLGVLIAPPGMSGEKTRVGAYLEAMTGWDNFFAAIDLGGILGQYGYITLDVGVILEL